jgi:hypothetical protein
MGRLPNPGGGTITIHFGYGSRFDDMDRDDVVHQALICDDCYEKAVQKGLVRAVKATKATHFTVLSDNYRNDE